MPDVRLAGTPQDYSSASGWPTISYAANTGNNRVVVAVVGYEHAAPSGTSSFNIAMGSVPFTTAAFSIGTAVGQGATAVCYITEQNIPSGSQSITSTSINPSSGGGGYAVTLYTLENVDQIAPIFYNSIRDTNVSVSNLVSTISVSAGGFSIFTGASGTVATQPFSVSDGTWTERRDYRNAANDFGFFIYDKAYTRNKIENVNVSFSAVGRTSSIVTSFNPFVSNKLRFDTSANGYTFSTVSDGSLNNTISVNVPTNVANGDLMLGVVHVSSANNPGFVSPPSGWTEVANNFNTNGGFNLHTWVGYRIANTEPSSYQWGIETSSADDQAWILRVTGHNSKNVIDSVGTFFGETLVTPGQNVNSFTTTSNNSMVVYILGAKNGAAGYVKANGTSVNPTGTTQLLHQKTRVFSQAVGTSIAYEYKPTAGSTGTKTFTAYDTTGAYWSTIGFAIKQAPYSTFQGERLRETGRYRNYTDNFNRADNAVELGPDWNTRQGSLRIINNEFYGSGSCSYGDVDSSIVDFSDDHSAQVTVKALGTADLVGPAVRVTANGCYAIKADGVNASDRRIQYISGTTLTTIGTVNIVPVVGDILKLTVQGSVITAYQNGVQVDQVSNTAWTTGQPGVFYVRGNLNVSKGDDFYAEDLNSPLPGTMVKFYSDGTVQAGWFSEKEYIDRIKMHTDGDVWAAKFIETE